MVMREQPHESTSWRYTAPAMMDDDQYQQWVTLLEQRTGIALPEARKTFLVTKLAIRMRELGVKEYQEYFNRIVATASGQVEWETLVDRLTVHETRFFRDSQALQFIRDSYLPQLVKTHSAPYTINVWSVGCATGEEPYSLAMVLESFFGQLCTGFYFGITASDVSRAALQTAREGRYHRHRVKNVPELLARQYLQTVDVEHVQVNPVLQQHICFVPINMLELDEQKVGQMDIIVCQNVLIYFKQDRRQKVLDALATHLKPGGILILGPGEVIGWSHPQLATVNSQTLTAYQRKPVAAGGA